MEGKQMPLFQEWLGEWGIPAQDVRSINLRCRVEHNRNHTICSVYLIPETPVEPLRYTQSVWKDIPKILSLGATGTVPIKGIFVNAQSLSATKWEEIRTMGMRERAQIVAVAEVWALAKREAQFVGYRRQLSRHMGLGKGMAIWVHADNTTHLERVHDDRWVFAVLAGLTHHAMLIIAVHMPQRREPALYAQCLATLTALRELYAGIECLICGDWNRFVLEHLAIERWLHEMKMFAHSTG